MPLRERARINGVALSYEEVGDGVPMIFVHEFAGEAASWQPQIRSFSRRYRTITFNATRHCILAFVILNARCRSWWRGRLRLEG